VTVGNAPITEILPLCAKVLGTSETRAKQRVTIVAAPFGTAANNLKIISTFFLAIDYLTSP